MKLRLPHAPYVANKIALDLVNSGYVTVIGGIEKVSQIAKIFLEEDIRKEMSLEEKVRALLEANIEEIEFMRADEKQFFWLAKKRLAQEEGFLLSWDDRYSDLSHKILNELNKEEIIEFRVSDTLVKNVIFKAIDSYVKSFEQIEESVLEKIEHYKRKLIAGTEEYDLVFEKLYEEELKKRGFL